MILDRLLIRHKLNLLVSIPLVTIALLMVTLLVGQVGQARQAASAADAADSARRVSTLVEEIQRVRLLSVGYLDTGLVPAATLDVQLALVADTRAQLLRDLGTDADPELLQAVRGAGLVTDLGPLIFGDNATDQGVVGVLTSVIDKLITALSLDRQPAAGVQQTWPLSALGSLLYADESSSRFGVLLLMSASSPAVRAQTTVDAAAAQGLERQHGDTFVRLASSSQIALFRQATLGEGAQRLADASAEVGLAGATEAQSEVARHAFAAVQSQTTLRQLVESSIAQEISLSSRRTSSSVLIGAILLIGFALALLIGIVLLSVLVGRSVSFPLRRLTGAAGAVADIAAEELANVTDDDVGPDAVRGLAALPVGSRDELGELAVAFNRVQVTTAQLLERQIASRRNVAAMFASIGRRTSNLVGRQLSLIDVLEGAEEDSRILHTLYRLDHLSTRLRRNASSLVVLSGDRETTDDTMPVSLPDAVRAALGSIEDFQRVSLSALPEVHLSPGASADVVLIMSELIENGVLFSPPHTSVEVGAWVTDDARYALTVVDHGIGMPATRLAEENARLQQRERLDLAPTDVLGLFVVGRISRRHGIEVTLIPTPGGGVSARVELPPSLFVENPWSGATIGFPRARRPVLPQNGVPQNGVPQNGMPQNGMPQNGMPQNGMPQNGMPQNGVPQNGVPQNGMPPEPPVPPKPPKPPEPPAPKPPEPPAPQPPDGVRLPVGVRRRVPGTHWEGPPPVAGPAPVDDATPSSSPDQSPATHVAAPTDGVPAGLVSGAVPGPPDPEATRRQMEDLETALAGVDQPPAPGPGEPEREARPETGTSWPQPDAGSPEWQPDAGSPAEAGPPAADEPVGKLARRVPGATLASLGVVMPSAPRPFAPSLPPVEIDPDETLRVILDVDEAVRRARAQNQVDGDNDGYGATDGAVSRWGGREDGGGR